MQFEGYRKVSHVPNLTPLIDIVFLLLIFFMLTSHFVADESIHIELPNAVASAEKVTTQKRIEVILKDNGDYYFENSEIDAQRLLSVLREKLAGQKTAEFTKTVYIKGDSAVNLGKAVELVDIIRKAGAESVEVMTRSDTLK